MIPELGKKYYFFDDGKISPSRCYVAEVKEIITKKEAKKLELYYQYDEITTSLYRIWRQEIDNHRGWNENATGTPWLYAEDTDYFVACSIPNYDENLIWFVRDIRGGWFSLNIQSCWQGGQLDITGKIYENAKYNFDLSNYNGCYDSLLNEVLKND